MMIADKQGVKALLILWIVVLALALLPSQGWAPPPGPRDRDNDTYFSDEDCDDRNAAIYPGAPELCGNGVDDNCDGQVDEGCGSVPACNDIDGDSFFAESGCPTVSDCNDNDSAIYPGASEVCADSVDNNCDGQVDEGCGGVADSDRDGLDNSLEVTGFPLSPEFELWDSSTDIPGGASGLPIDQRLDENRPDLFVIVRLATPTNLDASIIEEYFQFAENPISADGLGWKVWVLRERSVTATRQITPESPQKAPILIESLDLNGIAQGVAQYATIMVEGKGIARFFSQRVVNSIEAACLQSTGGPCKDVSGALYPSELKFLHFQWVMFHEVLHILFELDNILKTVEGHHLTRGDYVMKPAVVYTNKGGKITYYIPQEVSRTAQNNWHFYVE